MIGILIDNTEPLLAVRLRGYAGYNGNDNGYIRSFFSSVKCAVCINDRLLAFSKVSFPDIEF